MCIYAQYEHDFISHYSKSTRFLNYPSICTPAHIQGIRFVLENSPGHERILENGEIINFLALKRA